MRVERRRLGLSLKAEAESGLLGLSSITHTGVRRDDNDAKAEVRDGGSSSASGLSYPGDS